MYHTIGWYNGAVTIAAENLINAVTDTEISIQNNAFIFTGNYPLLAVGLIGASVQYGRFFSPEWAGRGQPNIFAANRAATPPALPYTDKYFDKNLMVPQAQQLQLYMTNNAAAAEKEAAIAHIGTPQWTMNQPQGMYDIILHATCAVTNVAGSWVEGNAITFASPPLGGVYVVMGTQVVGASAYAYRWVFPRSPNYNGRRMRPGGFVLTAWGNQPDHLYQDPFKAWGPQGAFWTYEQPTFGTLGQTAGAVTYDIFMKCRFLGESPNLLDGIVNQI